MKKLIAFVSICFAPSLSGCGPDIASFNANPISPFNSAVSAQQAAVAQIIGDFQSEAKETLWLSNGSYPCGYPNTTDYGEFINAKNPKQFATQPYNTSAEWEASIKVLQAYTNLLQSAVNQYKIEAKYTDELTSAVKSGVSAFSIASPFSNSVGPIDIFAKDLEAYAAEYDIKQIAITMQGPLQEAVSHLKIYYPKINESATEAFKLWDSCAADKLNWLRDKNYYGNHVGQSSSIDMADAYTAYQVKRQDYLGKISQKPILDALDKIISANNDVIKQASTTNMCAFVQAGFDGANLAYGIYSEAHPAKPHTPVRTPTKPAQSGAGATGGTPNSSQPSPSSSTGAICQPGSSAPAPSATAPSAGAT